MSCHSEGAVITANNESLVILAGQPNVGKSVIFKRLTGRYVAVSNYPGTTVEVTQGDAMLGERRVTLIDSPGINSLQPLAEDERVTRSLLLGSKAGAVVQVADAKNLSRALFLSLQFAELELPLVLALNMTDEAERRGVRVDTGKLSEILQVGVVATIATNGQGIEDLVKGMEHPGLPAVRVEYSPEIEQAVAGVELLLPRDLGGKRWYALSILAGDDELEDELLPGPAHKEAVQRIRDAAQRDENRPLAQVITQQRWKAVASITDQVYLQERHAGPSWGERFGSWAVHPVLGWPILMLALFLVYKFVGELGAGTLVNFFQGVVFGQWINPAATHLLDATVPWPIARDFLVGDYGLLTVGLSYGIGIVLPIVSTFFIAFGILEDSGYLPRLSVMLNRFFKTIGLNGKAVLPMVLGLGCVTMATMTTRILGTRKERVMATLLLALSIPCSAQLGVMLAMLGWLAPWQIFVWVGVVVGVLLSVGWLAARVIPGGQSDFIMELPPIRLPQLDNLLVKTLARLEWYLKEVIPLFLVATAGLFVLARTGVLGSIEELAKPLVVGWLGLPQQTAGVFLVGFLRRDYGATGLFDLARHGLLTQGQMLVSLVVITLFVPCVATVMMILKEHGGKTAAAICAFVFPFAFLVGGVVRLVFGG